MNGISARFPFLVFQFALFFSLFGINPTGGIGGEGSVFRQFGWLLLAGLSLFALAQHADYRRGVLLFLRQRSMAVVLLSAFCLLAMASSLWSEVPFITFKRALLLLVVLLVCVITVACARVRGVDLASLLVTPLLSLLLLSVLFSLVFPGIAFSDIGWQGITGQKNEMGQLAAMLILALALSRRALAWPTAMRWLLGAAALGALALSRSGTAMVGLAGAAAAIGLVLLARQMRRQPSWIVPVFLVAGGVAGLLFIAFLFDVLPTVAQLRSAFFALLGKSETLTGRTALWDLVLSQSRFRSEWFGGGYGGFWDISNERVLYIISRLGFRPIQAHNGYLEVFNDLGYIGLAMAVGILAYYVLHMIRHLFAAPGLVVFHVALCVYVIEVNFSESALFRTTQFLNLLFVASFLLVAGKLSAPRPVTDKGIIPVGDRL
jgi:O-antigen ligase